MHQQAARLSQAKWSSTSTSRRVSAMPPLLSSSSTTPARSAASTRGASFSRTAALSLLAVWTTT